MKTVLCYGDSNTWGYDPLSEGRYPYEQRWSSFLARELGADYLVIPEVLTGARPYGRIRSRASTKVAKAR